MVLGSTHWGRWVTRGSVVWTRQFLADVDPATALRVIALWQDELWMRAKILERAHGSAQAASADETGFPVLPLVLARRLRHVSADVAFLNELRGAYEKWLESSSSPRVERASAETTATERTLRRRTVDRAPR